MSIHEELRKRGRDLLLSLDNKHKDETIFVIAGGPQVGRLSDEQLRWLETRISIGCNQSMYYLKSTYWAATHLNWGAFWHYHEEELKPCIGLYMNPYSKDVGQCWLPEIMFHSEFPFLYDKEVHGKYKQTMPSLEMKPHITMATKIIQLAAYMGASEIVCIGIEMRSLAHCYTYDVDRVKILKGDFIRAKKEYPFIPEDDFIGTERSIQANADKIPFNQKTGWSPVPMAKAELGYINEILYNKNIELICAAEDSIMLDIGIKYRSLDSYRP